MVWRNKGRVMRHAMRVVGSARKRLGRTMRSEYRPASCSVLCVRSVVGVERRPLKAMVSSIRVSCRRKSDRMLQSENRLQPTQVWSNP
eukprot:1180648-Prorocentrum_minimum.AAC.2